MRSSTKKLLSDQITCAELEVVLRYCSLAVQQNTPGDIVELGCYVGTTSVHLQKIATEHNRTLHVYDSFEGLPPKTEQDSSPAGINFQAGELATSKKVLLHNFIKHNLPPPIIHKGWFCDLKTTDMPADIAFAFLDGDFYQSITDSLRVVWPHVCTGGFVLVHDYGRTTLPGAKRAVHDFMANHTNGHFLRVEQHIGILRKRP